MWYAEFRAWLGAQMRAHDIRSAAQLARELGVSNAAVRDWMRGHERPRPESCRRLAERFEVAPEEVLALAEYPIGPEMRPSQALFH